MKKNAISPSVEKVIASEWLAPSYNKLTFTFLL